MADNIRDAILNLVGDEFEVRSVIAKVSKVSPDAETIDVEPVNGDAEIKGVRIVSQSGAGFKVVPLIGSTVICTFLDQNNAFASMISKADKIAISNDFEDLKSIIQDLCLAISQITVLVPPTLPPNPAPAPTTVPVNAAAFQVISQRLNLLLQ